MYYPVESYWFMLPYRSWWGTPGAALWSRAEVWASLWLFSWWVQHQEWWSEDGYSSDVSVSIYLYIIFLLDNCSVNWVCCIFLYIIFNGYRSDVEEGGETIFPDANVNASSLPWYNELSECAKRGLSVKPKMGDALLFWSMKPDATLDPLSLHG